MRPIKRNPAVAAKWLHVTPQQLENDARIADIVQRGLRVRHP